MQCLVGIGWCLVWRDRSGPGRKQLHVYFQLYLDLHLYVFHMSTYFYACIFCFYFSLFCKFLIVEMKSKQSTAPITTQFRLKVVCVQCSDEISTVSLFLVCLSLFVFLGVLFVCDTDSTGCEITFHSLFVCLFVCLFV